MFYFATIKNEDLFGFHEIKKNTLEEAEKYLEAYILVNKPKTKRKNYKIITKEEYDKIMKAREKAEEDRLKLDKRAKWVAENVLNIKLDLITKEKINNYCLQKDTDKQYYAVCYWGNGSNGSFCSLEDLKELYLQKATACYDDGFSISVTDVDNEKDVHVSAEFSVKLTIE